MAFSKASWCCSFRSSSSFPWSVSSSLRTDAWPKLGSGMIISSATNHWSRAAPFQLEPSINHNLYNLSWSSISDSYFFHLASQPLRFLPLLYLLYVSLLWLHWSTTPWSHLGAGHTLLQIFIDLALAQHVGTHLFALLLSGLEVQLRVRRCRMDTERIWKGGWGDMLPKSQLTQEVACSRRFWIKHD